MQTLIISPRLLFRKMIIAQLELGPPVELVNGNGGGGVVGTAEGRSGERIVSSLLMYKVKAGDAVWANKMRTSWKLNSSNININVFPSVSIHFKMGTSYHLVSWKTRCERNVRRKLFWYQALSWDTTHPHSLDIKLLVEILLTPTPSIHALSFSFSSNIQQSEHWEIIYKLVTG